MARKINSVGSETKKAINAAAVELFATHGFANVSLREVAKKVNLQVGSLYNHFPSKQDLLFSIVDEEWRGLFRDYVEQVASMQDPLSKLRAMVRAILLRYSSRTRVRLAMGVYLHVEFGPKQFKIIRRYREKYIDYLRDILTEGVSAGVFEIADIRLTARAIIGLIRDVYSWYSPRGRFTPEQLIDFYDDYVLKLVGIDKKSLELGIRPKRDKSRKLSPRSLSRAENV